MNVCARELEFMQASRYRIVVSTSRCGRDNPGSNPGAGRFFLFFVKFYLPISVIKSLPYTITNNLTLLLYTLKNMASELL